MFACLIVFAGNATFFDRPAISRRLTGWRCRQVGIDEVFCETGDLGNAIRLVIVRVTSEVDDVAMS